MNTRVTYVKYGSRMYGGHMATVKYPGLQMFLIPKRKPLLTVKLQIGVLPCLI